MIAKFTKTADGLALILDQDLVDRLQWKAGTPVEVTDDGRVMTIAPAAPARPHEREFHEAVEWAFATYPNTMRDLAK